MKRKIAEGSAMAFIILMGIVSLFSDMTHEGARSILGSYLSLAGASAATIGFVSGFGELCGYSLRLISGFLADRTKMYWPFTLAGYIIQVVAIPAIALVPQGGWVVASMLIIAERVGKAIKKPAKNTMISFAASQTGQGKGFAYQEFLDQLGAFLGPLILFLVCWLKGTDDLFSTYKICFALLGVPAIITIILLLVARHKFPDPSGFEKVPENSTPFKMKKPFVLYIIAISFCAFGFVDFTLITMHTSKTGLIAVDELSLLYAGAMAIDAFAALFFGWLFDRCGIGVLMLSTLLAAPFAILIFGCNSRWALFLGVALWGIGMGAQESILKSAVSSIVPKQNRSFGFGIFETAFGIAWFLGSWLMGALYDSNIKFMIVFSVIAQIISIPFYYSCIKNNIKEA
ncbi:MAG: MFS transporter [Candidatus Metalachnospira sp.]|nr:MFS transporter [Candidatus Metalachnospira sp.]